MTGPHRLSNGPRSAGRGSWLGAPERLPSPAPVWARHQAGTSGDRLIPSFPEAFEVDFAVSQVGKLRLQGTLSQEGLSQESARGCRRPEPSSGLRSRGQRCSERAGPPLRTVRPKGPSGRSQASGTQGPAPLGPPGRVITWPSAHPGEGDRCPLGSSHGPASQLGAAP